MGVLRIDKKKDNRVIRAFTHKLADIPNGITVSAADLTQKVLHEGTPVGKDENGLYHVVKVAVLSADATNTATAYTVKKGHNFKVGDVVMLATGSKAYTITGIATNASDATSDDLTVDTTLGTAAKAGDAIYNAAKAGASGSAFKYEPIALVGESYDVEALSNHIVNAWTIGQIRESNIPPVGSAVKAKLPGMVFI
nr:MAG: head fiber protein [Bacteriophage sp.]